MWLSHLISLTPVAINCCCTSLCTEYISFSLHDTTFSYTNFSFSIVLPGVLFSAQAWKIKKFHPDIFWKMERSSSNIKRFFTFSYTSRNITPPPPPPPQKKKIFIFKETETLKIFTSTKSCSYISGIETYFQETETLKNFVFQEVTFRARKVKRNHS